MQAKLRALSGILVVIFWTAFSFAEVPPVLLESLVPKSGVRIRVFVSDLHFGIGRAGTGETAPWHPMEDFRWADDFDKFLTELEARGTRLNMPFDLVILGDFLELWQTPWAQMDCIYDGNGKPLPADKIDVEAVKDVSCTEADALKRLERVLAAHDVELKRIARFARFGDNTVTIVPGNHDAALVFPSVGAAVLQRIGAPPDRVLLASQGYWRSGDGLVLAEHGHFMPGDVNKYDRFPASCLALNGKAVDCKSNDAFLQRPWGEQFVQRYYNQFEERYPIIDNITNELAGVKLALSEATAAEKLQAVADGFKFLLFGESRAQLLAMFGKSSRGDSARMLGGGAAAPEWELKEVRAKGDRFLVDSMDAADPLKAAAESALASGKLAGSMDKLSDTELTELCDGLAARRQLDLSKGASSSVTLCPGGGARTLGAVVTAITKSAATVRSERLEQMWKALPNDRPTRDFRAYIYAHTHSAHAGCTPRRIAGPRASGTGDPPAEWNPVAVNTGAWQRLTSPGHLAKLREANKGWKLSAFQPEHLPACYSVVVLPHYDAAAGPSPQLWFWGQNPKGGWQLLSSCPQDEERLSAAPCQ